MESCTFCKSFFHEKKFDIKIVKGTFQIRRCTSCSAFFLYPMPSNKQLNDAYNLDYYGEGNSKFNPIVESIVNIFRRMRANRAIKKISANSNILDIGCGNGGFLNFLSKYHQFNLYGTEIEGHAAKRAANNNKGFTLYIGSLNSIDFHDQKFDLITMYHVFEHLTTPNEDIEIIKKLLKHNGKLVISIPNINSWQAQIFRSKWLHLDVPRHLIFFAPKAFKSTMQSKGFVILSERYVSWEQNPFGYIQSCLNIISSKHNLLYEVLKKNKVVLKNTNVFEILLHILFASISLPFFLFLDLIECFFKKSGTVEFIFIYQPRIIDD